MALALFAAAAAGAVASDPIPPKDDLLAGAAAGALPSETIPPDYQLLETISIPPDGAYTTSATVLGRGVAYRLVAYGTDPGAGDAEYDPGGRDRCGTEVTPTDVGIRASTGLPAPATSYFGDKLPFWGPFNPAHVYTVAVTGTGNHLAVSYSDCDYSDNLGGLTLLIFGPRSSPSCDVVFTQPTFEDGALVTPRVISLRNNSTTPVAVEFTLWLRMPGFGPLTLVKVGADSQFQLPAHYEKEFNYPALFTVTPDFPRGTYELSCTIAEPATGVILDWRLDRFGIR